jgi:hypothetical protein
MLLIKQLSLIKIEIIFLDGLINLSFKVSIYFNESSYHKSPFEARVILISPLTILTSHISLDHLIITPKLASNNFISNATARSCKRYTTPMC